MAHQRGEKSPEPWNLGWIESGLRWIVSMELWAGVTGSLARLIQASVGLKLSNRTPDSSLDSDGQYRMDSITGSEIECLA
jgi:hypothetical protein